jgi:hypothetical protein
MTRWIAPLALLALAACAGEAPAPAASHGPALALTPTDTRWLAPEEPGYAQQVAWGLALPADFSIVELTPDELRNVACARDDGSPAPELVAGCAHGSAVAIRNNLTTAERRAVLLHEMGHVLARRHGHIEDAVACPVGAPGLYVMCAESDGSIDYPAPEDFDFVLAARG